MQLSIKRWWLIDHRRNNKTLQVDYKIKQSQQTTMAVCVDLPYTTWLITTNSH